MRKSAFMNGIQNIGGAVSALANPYVGSGIHPERNQMEQNNPLWEHIQKGVESCSCGRQHALRRLRLPLGMGQEGEQYGLSDGFGRSGGMEGQEYSSGAAPVVSTEVIFYDETDGCTSEVAGDDGRVQAPMSASSVF